MVVVTATMVNMRFVIFSAASRKAFTGLPWYQRLSAGYLNGDVPFALTATQTMYEITQGEHPTFQVPILDFRGTPTGIDVTKVIRTGILPQINTGMAGRVAGTGQVGAGLVTPPMDCFTGAIDGLAAAVREAT